MSLFARQPIGFDLSLSNMLEIENTSSVLDLRSAVGIPIWAQVRVGFFRMLIADSVFSSVEATDSNQRHDMGRGARTLIRSILRNRSLQRTGEIRADVLLTTEAVADQRVDGSWYNRQSDGFAQATPGRAAVLIDQDHWAWRQPRAIEQTIYHAPIQAGVAIRARFQTTARQRRDGNALAAFASERGRDLLGWEMGAPREAALGAVIARKLASAPLQYRAYRKLLRRVSPKLLLGSSGCYGHTANLIAAARDLGIVTAEYQHGAVSQGHDAYNFSDTVRNDANFRRAMPEYFLTFGTWWNDQINAPTIPVAIGSPHRELRRIGAGTATTPGGGVLVLSDGIEFDLYMDLAARLRFALPPEIEVVLRPHPLERGRAPSGGQLSNGVVLDPNLDIYTSFWSARAVVSEVSTGLFEAIGLVEKIIMLETPKARFTYPEHPFISARSVDEVIELVVGGPMTKISPASIWANDWRGAYQGFLRDKVGL